MKKILPLFILFSLTACGTVQRIDDKVDLAKDAAITALERSIDKARQALDRLEAEHREDARRIERLKQILGHD